MSTWRAIGLFVALSLSTCNSCNASVLGRTFFRKHRRPQDLASTKPWRRQRHNVDDYFMKEASISKDQKSEGKILNKVNEALRNTRPIQLAGLGSAAVLTEHLRRNRQATRRAFYFWRRAGPIVVHYRFTQWWLDSRSAPKEKRDLIYDRLHNRYCQPSLELILHLQGLYVKIGQVLSARPDFIPRQYIELFTTVQDSIPPFPVSSIEKTMRHALWTERGLRFEDVFESMDDEALGSASIGQVHRAILKSPWDRLDGYKGGKVVAVKVMSPGAESRFTHDFQVFRWLCRVALPGWKPILQELERQMMTEFDYQNEAASLDQIRTNMANTQYRKQIVVPEPVLGLCCKEVLVMEMLEGKKLSETIEDKLVALLGHKDTVHEFLKKKREGYFLEKEIGGESLDHDLFDLLRVRSSSTRRILPKLFGATTASVQLLSLYRQMRHFVNLLVDVHGHQIFVDGCFNGDCHPGNILWLVESGDKLGLIDYGQTRRLSNTERLGIARVVSALGKDPSNVTVIANAMRECGFQTKFDKDDVLARYAALFFDNDADAKRLGCATPQMYLLKLAEMDPLLKVPDAAVFVARTSYMFRGMGAMMDMDQVYTAKRWWKHADMALSSASRTD